MVILIVEDLEHPKAHLEMIQDVAFGSIEYIEVNIKLSFLIFIMIL